MCDENAYERVRICCFSFDSFSKEISRSIQSEDPLLCRL